MDILPYQRGSSIAHNHNTTLRHIPYNSYSAHAVRVSEEKTPKKQTANTSHFVDPQQLSDAAEKLWLKNAQDSDPLLGTITEYNSVLSNFSKTDEQTAETSRSRRDSNFSLLHSAKNLLAPTKQSRICVCFAHRIDQGLNVQIKHNNKSGVEGRASFDNLVTCGAIHTCIICNNRIMQKRSVEIAQGYDYFTKELGGFVPMLTLTIPHYKGGDLVKQIELINLAYKRLMGDRIMRKVWGALEKIGSIKAVEYTHGKNGHHNHIHSHIYLKKSHENQIITHTLWTTPKRKGELRLLNAQQEQEHIDKGLAIQKLITQSVDDFTKDCEKERLKPYIIERRVKKFIADKAHAIKNPHPEIIKQTVADFIKFYWAKLCVEVGLGAPSLERGAVFTSGDKVKSYLAKHKSAQEITNSRDKKAKNGNRNQWELLLDYQGGDRQAGDVFKEYASAFSGSQLLQWSRGLKEIVLIDEVKDDITGLDENDKLKLIKDIPNHIWRLIKRYGKQAKVLAAVENDIRYGGDTTVEYDELIKEIINNHIERQRKKALAEQKRLENYIPEKFMKAS